MRLPPAGGRASTWPALHPVSIGQPPLARALYALPVIVQRPALPPDSNPHINAERAAGSSFLKLNARRFGALFLSAGWSRCCSRSPRLLIIPLRREPLRTRAGLLALGCGRAMPEGVARRD